MGKRRRLRRGGNFPPLALLFSSASPATAVESGGCARSSTSSRHDYRCNYTSLARIGVDRCTSWPRLLPRDRVHPRHTSRLSSRSSCSLPGIARASSHKGGRSNPFDRDRPPRRIFGASGRLLGRLDGEASPPPLRRRLPAPRVIILVRVPRDLTRDRRHRQDAIIDVTTHRWRELASIVARRGRDYYRETACTHAIHCDCRLDPPARFPALHAPPHTRGDDRILSIAIVLLVASSVPPVAYLAVLMGKRRRLHRGGNFPPLVLLFLSASPATSREIVDVVETRLLM